ncbi:MAG: hypothetical protein AAF805_02100 [Planctomycetota bacterium]
MRDDDEETPSLLEMLAGLVACATVLVLLPGFFSVLFWVAKWSFHFVDEWLPMPPLR